MTLVSHRLLKPRLLIILILGMIPCLLFVSGWHSNGLQPEGPAFQKGMAFPTWIARQYGSEASDESLKALVETTCADFIQLVPTWYQQNRIADVMSPDYDGQTARMESLRHAIRTAHDLGLKVMLKPHVDAQSGDWRGTFVPENPQIWFTNYTEMMKTYARVAREENVDILCVGCEFVELTTAVFTEDWKGLIHEVREIYAGPLIYAANWGRETRQVEFWDVLDFIGIDAYYGLTDTLDPTIKELIAAWQPFVSEIESVYLTWQKPVVLTEIGFRSMDGANRQPWDWEASGKVDLAEQALCYQAVIKVFDEKTWFRGIYWWNWEPDPRLGGPADSYYTPQGKPAESILKRWYCIRRHDQKKKRPKIIKL